MPNGIIDTCAFCGHTGPSREDFRHEHWVPQWLNRELFPRLSQGPVVHNTPHSSWEADAFEMVVEHVCEDCNGGWMSDIETKAKKHVLPFILGVANSVGPHGLNHVARWCYLKVVSLELGRPQEQEPTHDHGVYRAFKEKKNPPYPNCTLALGIRDINETSPVFVSFESQAFNFTADHPDYPDLPTFEGYRTTLLVGHLVIDVFGTAVPVPVTGDHGDGYSLLWPLPVTGGTFTWPPARRWRWNDGLELLL